ncbi:MAG: hypothetical protein U0165_11780 [Polyangiaceae bacterium]
MLRLTRPALTPHQLRAYTLTMGDARVVGWLGAAMMTLLASGCQPSSRGASSPANSGSNASSGEISSDACVFGRPNACKSACDKNDPKACANLGAMYAVGRGVAPDRAKGEDLLRQSCAAGASRGCAGAALVLIARTEDELRTGGKLSQSERRGRAREAMQLMAQACKLGERFACNEISATEEMSNLTSPRIE